MPISKQKIMDAGVYEMSNKGYSPRPKGAGPPSKFMLGFICGVFIVGIIMVIGEVIK